MNQEQTQTLLTLNEFADEMIRVRQKKADIELQSRLEAAIVSKYYNVLHKQFFSAGWTPRHEKPKETLTALCWGAAPDSCPGASGNEYFVAQYMFHWDDPKWVYGKDQKECQVTMYKPVEL